MQSALKGETGSDVHDGGIEHEGRFNAVEETSQWTLGVMEMSVVAWLIAWMEKSFALRQKKI